MLGRQTLLRASRFAGQTARQPAIRNTTARRQASHSPDLTGPANNAFNRERAAVKEHAAATSGLWRKLSIYAVVPCLLIAGANAYVLWNEHWAHWAHMPPLEERTEYAYQNIRKKNYCWGDGDKTLFWNSEVNYHNQDK